METTGIVAAMREELAPLLARTDVERRGKLGDCQVSWGRLGGAPVVIARTGEGRRKPERGAMALLAEAPVSRLLIIGVSGALSPGLEPGELVVGERVLRDGATAPAPDADWVAAAMGLDGATGGTLVTAGKILWTSDSKTAAGRRLDGPGPAAVDLETAAYAGAAAAAGVPWLAVRAICDPAEEDLPLDFNEFLDGEGCLQRDRIMFHALRHPSLMRPLREMQQRVADGAGRLADFIQRLLEAPERGAS